MTDPYTGAMGIFVICIAVAALVFMVARYFKDKE